MIKDYGTIVLVKGTSGSGKSTRVYCFLDFLESIGVEFQPYRWVNSEGKEKEVGVYVPEFNLIVIGKFYENQGVRRWQGLDSVTSRFVNSAGVSDFLKEVGMKRMNVLLEGAGTSVSWRLRPMELIAVCEFMNILYVRYDFTEKEHEEYYDRVVYRSGKPPKGDAMWHKRSGFESDIAKSREEAALLNAEGANVVIKEEAYSSPVWDLGCSIFEFFGVPEICGEFREYVNKGNYINQNRYAEQNNPE
jgi:hypothetical protein